MSHSLNSWKKQWKIGKPWKINANALVGIDDLDVRKNLTKMLIKSGKSAQTCLFTQNLDKLINLKLFALNCIWENLNV